MPSAITSSSPKLSLLYTLAVIPEAPPHRVLGLELPTSALGVTNESRSWSPLRRDLTKTRAREDFDAKHVVSATAVGLPGAFI